MMKKKLFIFITLLVLLLCSCKTYVPVVQPVDITLEVKILKDQKPDNESFEIIPSVQTSYDIIHNSKEYLRAWQQWENYALSLEDFLGKLSAKLNTL